MPPQWRDDAFLTPVLENDALLFGLDADFEDDAAPDAADDAAVGALAAENETLKLQARAWLARVPLQQLHGRASKHANAEG